MLSETSPRILLAWLESLGWEPADYQIIQVDTQVEYEALPDHISGSRPDMRIELCVDERHDLIFIKSKLGAGEGDHQLQRYAEILDADHSANQKWLIDITREKDTKNPGWIFQNIPGSQIKFLQKRWRDFYGFLVAQAQNPDKRKIFSLPR